MSLLKEWVHTPVRMAAIKKSTNDKCWRECGEKGTLLHWWECKLVQPLWRTVWRFLKKLEIELPYLNGGVGEDFWESLGLQEDPTSSSYRKSVLNINWKDRSWSWSFSTLATWCEVLTYWINPELERLKAGGEGDSRGWDGLLASPTQWTWVWVNSRNWWWTGRPGVLQFMG